MSAILALDQGTTASKAAVYSSNGRLLGVGRVKLASRFGSDGRAVQDPVEIISSQKLAIRRALAAAGRPKISVTGVSSQRSTFVLWDRKTGKPVGPAPTWQDTTASDLCAELASHAESVRQRTGLPLSPHYSASKVSRLFSSRPTLLRKAERGDLLFGNVATWIIWHLTGGQVHATDPTHAARSLLFNLDTLSWDPWLIDLFGIPRSILPEARHSLGDYGAARINGRDVPIRSCLGDQQAALIGLTGLNGGHGRGTALVNYGTGAFVLMPTGSQPRRREGMLTSFAWTSAKRKSYLLEGTVNPAGATLDWLRRDLGAPESLSRIEKLCRNATGEAYMLPAFWGLGSAYTTLADTDLPSVMVNTGPPPGPADLTRAGVEAIAHLVSVVLERGAGSSRPVRKLVATGSLAHLGYLLEFQAALLPGVSVAAAPEPEASLEGVARAAAGSDWGRSKPLKKIGVRVRTRQTAIHRHREWRRLIAIARLWKEVSEAYP